MASRQSLPPIMREPVNATAQELYVAWSEFKPTQTYDQFKLALGIVYPDVSVTTNKLFALDNLAALGGKWALVESLGRLYGLVSIGTVSQDALQGSVTALKLERVGLAQENPRIYVLRSNELDLVLFGGIEAAFSSDANMQGCLVLLALARI